MGRPTKQERIARSYEQHGGYREGAGRPTNIERGKNETVDLHLFIERPFAERIQEIAERIYPARRDKRSLAVNDVLRRHFNASKASSIFSDDGDYREFERLHEEIRDRDRKLEEGRKIMAEGVTITEQLQAKIADLEANLSLPQRASRLMELAAQFRIDPDSLEFTAERGGRPRAVVSCFSEEDIAALPEDHAEMVRFLHRQLLTAAACISAMKKGGKA